MVSKVPINQIDLKTLEIVKTWESIAETSSYGYNPSRISLVCTGKARSSNKFGWEYADKEVARKYTSLFRQKENWKTKPVIFFSVSKGTTQIFMSCTEAASSFDTDPKTIKAYIFNLKRFISGKRPLPKYYKNGVLLYEEDDFEIVKKKINSLGHKCNICLLNYLNVRSLASHIKKSHSISTKEYTIKYLLTEENDPKCHLKECNNETRYSTFSFKKYCKEHSCVAMKSGGEVGGKAEAWNKGLTKQDDVRILKQSIEMLGQKNHFYGKHHTKEVKTHIAGLKRLTKDEIIKRLKTRESDYTFEDFDFQEYTSRQFNKIPCKCVKCKRPHKKTLQSLERGSLCKFCYPFTVSKAEIEVGDFIENDLGISIERNNRKIINPYELDIYSAAHKVAVEYHGLYWHMDKGDKNFDKNLHIKKTNLCTENNIKLMQFFSCDWKNNKNIVKSMITNSFGKTKTKFGARDTIPVEVPSKIAKDFFNKNHLHRHVKAKKYFALKHKNTDEILSIVSVRKAFHKKYDNSIEIARFATKLNHNIYGGFSKLLKSMIVPFAKSSKCISVISYADLLTGTGNVYKKSGFTFIANTALNYWYTDGENIYNRFRFRATKEYSEKEIAKINDVYKVYGCGNSLFEMKI